MRRYRRLGVYLAILMVLGGGNQVLSAQLPLPNIQAMSVQKRPIQVFNFGNGDQAYVIFVGGFHGKEPLSQHLILSLMEELKRDPALYQHKTIYGIPLLNPDGEAVGSQTNAHGVDLSRQFIASEPEAQLVVKLVEHLERSKLKLIAIRQSDPESLVYEQSSHQLAKLMATLAHLPLEPGEAKPESFAGLYSQQGIPVVVLNVSSAASPQHTWEKHKEALLAVLRNDTDNRIPLNEYGLAVVNSFHLYQALLRDNPDKELVNLGQFIPDIHLDLRYATAHHFLKKKLYTLPRAYLRHSAAMALKKVQEELKQQGLGLKIFDAYRPYAVTKMMWEPIKDDMYVADPRHGSKHNRGCAVDLTLIDAQTGRDIEMPSDYLDFTQKAHHGYMQLPLAIIQRRELLKSIMEKYGFLSYGAEWWHYNYKDWEHHEILDISFEELEP